MRIYDLCLVLGPDQAKTDQEKLLAKIKGEVEKLDGKVEKQDEWGKRELSYPIKRSKEGVFFLLRLALPPSGSAALEKKIKIEEQILRYLLVKSESLPAGRQEREGVAKKN